MKKEKLYFREDDECCYPLDVFYDEMQDDGITEMKVFEAVPYTGKDCCFCQATNEICYSDEYPCGKNCEDYEPKNGKSGMCKHKKRCYTIGKEVIIRN